MSAFKRSHELTHPAISGPTTRVYFCLDFEEKSSCGDTIDGENVCKFSFVISVFATKLLRVERTYCSPLFEPPLSMSVYILTKGLHSSTRGEAMT